MSDKQSQLEVLALDAKVILSRCGVYYRSAACSMWPYFTPDELSSPYIRTVKILGNRVVRYHSFNYFNGNWGSITSNNRDTNHHGALLINRFTVKRERERRSQKKKMSAALFLYENHSF